MHSNWPEKYIKDSYFKNNKSKKKKHKKVEKTCFVYQVWFPEIDSYYIGMSYNPKQRLVKHKTDSNSTINSYIIKYKYEFDILYTLPSALWATAAEIERISFLRNLKLNVLNKTRGGEFHWTRHESKIVQEMLGNSHQLPMFIRNKSKRRKEKSSDKKQRQKANSSFWRDKKRKQEFFVPKSNDEWKKLVVTEADLDPVLDDIAMQSSAVPFSYENSKKIR